MWQTEKSDVIGWSCVQSDAVVLHQPPQRTDRVDASSGGADASTAETLDVALSAILRQQPEVALELLLPTARRHQCKSRKEVIETVLTAAVDMLRQRYYLPSVVASNGGGGFERLVHLQNTVGDRHLAEWVVERDLLGCLGVNEAQFLKATSSAFKITRFDTDSSPEAHEHALMTIWELLRFTKPPHALARVHTSAVLALLPSRGSFTCPPEVRWAAAIDVMVAGLWQTARCAYSWRWLASLLRLTAASTPVADFISAGIVRCLERRDRPEMAEAAALKTHALDLPGPLFSDEQWDALTMFSAEEVRTADAFAWLLGGGGAPDDVKELVRAAEAAVAGQRLTSMPPLLDDGPPSWSAKERAGLTPEQLRGRTANFVIRRRRFFRRFLTQHPLATLGGYHGEVLDDILANGPNSTLLFRTASFAAETERTDVGQQSDKLHRTEGSGA
jgi:hypothetical protein